VPFSDVAAEAGCAQIILGGPAKTFSLAGLHASFLVIPDADLRGRYLQYAQPAFLTYGSTFATVALLAAYERGGPWLNAARQHVANNVRLLHLYLRRHVPSVVARPVEATYCVWLDCSALGLSPASLTALMLRVGLVLSSGAEFDTTGESDMYQRINVACPRLTLEEALRRLHQAVDEHNNTREQTSTAWP
jgi:cystathionine beta-lyase